MTKKILIVDDEEIMRNFAAAVASSAGYDPICCIDGYDAINAMKKIHEEIDLVLMDLYMPMIDGISAIGHFRETYPNLPVIVVSGSDDKGDHEACYGLGVHKFLQKPVGAEDLRASIEEVLKSKEVKN